MDLGLAAKVVLVTGGARGIGLACTELFVAEGAHVAVIARSKESQARLGADMPGVTCIQADLGDAADAERAVAEAEARLGPIDVLVNCAGAAQRSAIADLVPATWAAAMDAKFLTYMHAITPAIRSMGTRGQGVVVNVIGIAGKVPSTLHLPGGAANAALMLATAGLASAYGPRGVRVVGVSPGATETELTTQRLRAEAALAGISVEEATAARVKSIPLGRMATPAEIANVVAFVASPRAGYVSGVNIGVDGALTAVIV